MSNSNLVSYTQISPNRNSPRTEPISKITIHHMAGNLTLQSFGAMVAKTSRQMSANYAIDSQGNRGLYCPESDRSWCSSSPWNDHRAVTIEVANDGGEPDWHVSDAAINSLIELCVDICKRNGMTRLEYGKDIQGEVVNAVEEYAAQTAKSKVSDYETASWVKKVQQVAGVSGGDVNQAALEAIVAREVINSATGVKGTDGKTISGSVKKDAMARLASVGYNEALAEMYYKMFK